MTRHRQVLTVIVQTPRLLVAELSARVREAVGGVVDPELRRTLAELDMIAHIEMSDDRVDVEVRLTIVGCPAASRIQDEVRRAAEEASGLPANVSLSVMTAEQRARVVDIVRAGRPARSMPFTSDGITRIIAVTSGKGGVGKSTITVNLAVEFARRGLRVGIIDADVHGFSIPDLLGVGEAKPTRVDSLILPPEAWGVRVISIGMFTESKSTPVAWRGPMLHRTIEQFLTDVYFGDLDMLLIDMPPGTGDVAISLGQLLPHAEVVVVTTPQSAAADVAERSGRVARQTGQRIVGVIENMAGLVLPNGDILDVFGHGGGQAVAKRLSESESEQVRLLGSVPLSVALREGGDRGHPIVLSDSEDPSARALVEIADELMTRRESLAGKSLPVSPRRSGE